MPEIISYWGLEPRGLRSDIELCGSPERCALRYAVEDTDGRVWVAERLERGQVARRQRLGVLLDNLAQQGLPVAEYRAVSDGLFMADNEQQSWQLSPFVQGDRLPQPQFIEDAWRGEALARFLVQLRGATGGLNIFDDEPGFSLPDYTDELLGTIELRHPDLFRLLRPVRVSVAPLFEAWSELPLTLSQGDFHPINVIWRGQGIAAVIDWEFAGMRPIFYDAANCMSCAGIEDPNALVRGLCAAMLDTLRRELEPDSLSLQNLPGLVLALRFAWMSEWLRRDDREMVQLELDYMTLLAENLAGLSNYWKL